MKTSSLRAAAVRVSQSLRMSGVTPPPLKVLMASLARRAREEARHPGRGWVCRSFPPMRGLPPQQ